MTNKILILKMTYDKFNLGIIIIMIFTLLEKHIVLFSEVTVSQRPLHEVCSASLYPTCSSPPVHNQEYSSERTRADANDANIAIR